MIEHGSERYKEMTKEVINVKRTSGEDIYESNKF